MWGRPFPFLSTARQERKRCKLWCASRKGASIPTFPECGIRDDFSLTACSCEPCGGDTRVESLTACDSITCCGTQDVFSKKEISYQWFTNSHPYATRSRPYLPCHTVNLAWKRKEKELELPHIHLKCKCGINSSRSQEMWLFPVHFHEFTFKLMEAKSFLSSF